MCMVKQRLSAKETQNRLHKVLLERNIEMENVL